MRDSYSQASLSNSVSLYLLFNGLTFLYIIPFDLLSSYPLRRTCRRRRDLMDQIRRRDQIIRDKDALIQQLLDQFEHRSLSEPYVASTSSPVPGTAPLGGPPALKIPETGEKWIQEWIDKAREMLRSSSGSFGGDFDTLVEDASDDGYSDDENAGKYPVKGHAANEDHDGDEDLLSGGGGKGEEESGDEESKRQDKAHVIPTAAPLGFIAAESIKKKRTRTGSSVGVQEADEVGLANESSFRTFSSSFFFTLVG